MDIFPPLIKNLKNRFVSVLNFQKKYEGLVGYFSPQTIYEKLNNNIPSEQYHIQPKYKAPIEPRDERGNVIEEHNGDLDITRIAHEN